ncbi:hypothetical protein DNTS_023765 [Danionella cerebrum]|uniref:tRNA-splicing endonuclease subunit SEN34 n=1 Tax=Danionella cerebrum TaxID=2873325 RepID=A0A553QV42_9TELE|nr:hypothetical protein DNTS_023765 [Danionella translucida]
MMVFFLSNMIENQCMSTGAFEITLNDVPVWSKLQSGQLPSMQQLVFDVRVWGGLVEPESSIVEPKDEGDARNESEHPSAGDAPVEIRLCRGTPLLWRMSELKRVRSMGVIGSLVGSLPRQPRQNQRLGRPLELREEEALLLLLEKDTAVSQNTPAFEDDEAHSMVVRQYEAALESSYKEQRTLALEDRKKTLMRVMNEKENDSDDSGSAIKGRLEDLEQSFCFPQSAMAVQLCTARAGFSHCAEEHTVCSSDWPLSRDQRLTTRFRVFHDLRSRGFYLTSAGKFGGDFLVYPGDPLRFHAHYIALCVSMDEELPLCDVLAIARLGSNVKKTILLCSPRNHFEDERHKGVEDSVVYSSLQWTSMF